MSALDQTLKDFPRPSWRTAAWSVIGVMGAGLLWASMATLDRIALADGVVAPQGRVRAVQHLEGGIADKILVRDGDVVEAGQELLHIDLGAGGLNTDEIQVRLDALRLERARLLAETAQIDLHLPAEESARQPDLARAEAALYKSRRREYDSRLAMLRDQKSQRELEVQSISTRLDAARRRMVPLREQRDIAETLSAAKLMARSQALTLAREYETVEGEIRALEVGLPQAQAALAEARERELHERNRFRNEASERLRLVEAEVARQRELLNRADDQAHRTVLRSPISGVVKNLSVHTIGGVVRPGEPVLEIVPSDENLVLEAQLSPNDIGHVAVGQPVTIKIATYDYMTYGALDGWVSHIAADATIDDAGRHFFRLIIETDSDALHVGEDAYPISPGMTATADIKLGERSVFRYLIDPIAKLRDEAFRDR